jgi:hypothetical protein
MSSTTGQEDRYRSEGILYRHTETFEVFTEVYIFVAVFLARRKLSMIEGPEIGLEE